MTYYDEINKALKNYLDSLFELKRLGVVRNKKDFTSQIGEWLVSELYGGQLAETSVQKYWDIKIGNENVQVKTHSKSTTTKNRWSAIKKDEYAQVQLLIIVIFSDDYKLKEFYKIPWKDTLKLIRRYKHGDVIYWDDLKKFQIKLDDLPKQKLISIFKPRM